MERELLVKIIVAFLGSELALEFFKAAVQAYKEKKRKPSAMEEGVRWLLQDKIEYLVTKEIHNGETSRQMKSFLRRGYEIYHELGGNGDMAALMQDYEEIPVKY